MKINKDKNIGNVLFIVEGASTEFKLLHYIFTKILGYKCETYNRQKKYRKSIGKIKNSSVFVINTKNTCIKSIIEDKGHIDELYNILRTEYHFDIDKAIVFYLFDRDVKSNTNVDLIKCLLRDFSNPLDNDNYERQGLILLSHPSIESYTISNYIDNTYHLQFATGTEVKNYMKNDLKISPNQFKLNCDNLINAVKEMEKALNNFGIRSYNLDNFRDTNIKVFKKQEDNYSQYKKYHLLSLLSIAFLYLGIIEAEI